MSFCHAWRCRVFTTIGVRSATIVGLLLAAFLAGPAFSKSDSPGGTTADRLVAQAGLAKSDGQMAAAYALLHEAVRIAPDNSLARWQLGQVNVEGEWLSIEEAERRAEADPRQARYQERKQALGESPQGQLELARWCRGNKLNEEAQFHWESVLAVAPNNREALRAIGKRWHDGELKTPAEITEEKKESGGVKRDSRRWTARVNGWLRALSVKNETSPAAVLDEVRAVTDLAAIPAFEAATLDRSSSANDKSAAPKRLSLAFIKALDKMRDAAATDSLLRYAVRSEFAEVRVEAIAELRSRPLTDFVPTLLDNLTAPVQSAFRRVNDADGSVHYLHAIYQEGPFADRAYLSQRGIYQPGSAGGMMPDMGLSSAINITGNRSRVSAVSSAGATRSARSYEQEILAREQQVEKLNEQSDALNKRIIAVLTGTTDRTFGNEPRAWWNWWQDYTDYYRGGERPVLASLDTSSQYVIPNAQPTSVECFARGTPVWTKTGQRPIESLQIGDLVLAQDVDTGAIRYKPIIGRTLRPAGPLVQVATGDETLLATRGHPLWVDGVGWRMTKELADGAMLQSLAGGGRIQSVRAAPDAETYNLVVADFNTYFVGKSGILAHDNTPRKPTLAIVPGILKKK